MITGHREIKNEQRRAMIGDAVSSELVDYIKRVEGEGE